MSSLQSPDYYYSMTQLQLVALVVDLMVNIFAQRFQHQYPVLVGAYLLQIAVIAVNVILLYAAFTNTQPYRCGFSQLLFSWPWRAAEFNLPIYTVVCYLILVVSVRSYGIAVVAL